MNNYTGQYNVYYCIVVKSTNHSSCLSAYNHIKYLSKAFDFGNVEIRESKFARKGEVLQRELRIRLKGFAYEIITFRQSLDLLLSHINGYDFRNKTTAIVDTSMTEREDAFVDFFE